MKLRATSTRFFLFLFVLMLSCRKLYEPPVIKGNNHFLAVDGFIQTGVNATSTFTLTRSRDLTDSIPTIPEPGAQVSIIASDGSSYSLLDYTGTGVYVSSITNLDSTKNYQLAINTSDGNKYLSDLVPTKMAPPIDSLSWELDIDPTTQLPTVNVFVNAHDVTNNTRYYRWDYLETFKHDAFYDAPWGEANGLIFPFPPDGGTYECWSTLPSTNILLGTSIALSQDIISHILIASYGMNDPKLDIGNSILVRQYPLTMQGYNFWLTVQQNSQSLGGLFDLQPAQISGNIHCLTNPNDPALGYISASTVQEKRIYISNKSLPGWKSNPFINCPQVSVLQDQLNLLVYNYPDTSYGPYHFAGDFTIYLVVAPKTCLDCRYQGGTNIKPDFWPQYD